MLDYQVDKETAEFDFQRWADNHNIDTDWDDLHPEDVAALLSSKRVLVRAIQQGKFKVSDEGYGVFTAEDGKEFPIRSAGGKTYAAADTKKDGQNFGKAAAMFGKISGTNSRALETMADEADVKIGVALVALFLG